MSETGSENRASISPHIQNIRSFLPEILNTLKSANENWYASIWLEKRYSRRFSINQRSRSMNEDVSEGIVLRIYDGHTLYEDASDQLTKADIQKQAQEFISKVKSKSRDESTAKYYKAPSWSERLQAKLDSEITLQIPTNPSPSTEVNFGTKYKQKIWTDNKVPMEYAGKLMELMQSHSAQLSKDDPCSSPDYLQVALQLNVDEFVFVDEETNLSQALERNRVINMVSKAGERGYTVNGGLGGIETVAYDHKIIEEAFSDLRNTLSADRIKAGRYKLLMGPDITGVFAHEAFGHSQEGDTCARARSKAWELYHSKESVGNEHATILNNPAIFKNAEYDYGAWGSYFFDEEGWLAQEQYLVKSGTLQAPMTNLTSAIRLGVDRTANGKRESWSHGVYTRQTNTYFSEGDQTFQQLMDKVDYGFLALNSAGGMEDPKGMGIQVGIAFVAEIKNGKLTGKTFKGSGGGSIQMTGYTPDYLNQIIAKAKIEAHSESADAAKFPENKVGGCGKYHKELVQAGCGGPYMLVDDVLLG